MPLIAESEAAVAGVAGVAGAAAAAFPIVMAAASEAETRAREICSTETQNEPCVFPFDLNGELYNKCTWSLLDKSQDILNQPVHPEQKCKSPFVNETGELVILHIRCRVSLFTFARTLSTL